MQKKLFILVISFTLIFIFLISNIPSAKAASTANIRYITTCVGENETSIGINYHCDVNNSYVIYGTSPSLTNNSSKVNAVSKQWGASQIGDDEETGFANRYVCSVDLTNLDEDTTYYYQVCAGNESSEVYSFTTYSSTGTRTNILFATDVHASASMPNTAKSADSMFTTLKNNYRNLNLVVMTGDQIDRGGYEKEWQNMYNNMNSFKELIQATIPGNHEYYHSESPDYISPEYYNQFYNNPKNGVEQRLNSSYYFKYGSILFIMIDTINREYLTEQQEWFKQVCEQNASQWIIVGTHAGGITAGIYAHDAKWIKENWVPLWEKYQVDLCLSGHEHIYIRKDKVYEDKINEDLGVTYLVGCAAGHKTYAVQDSTGLQVYKTSFAANLITVRNNKLEVTLFNQKGEELGPKFELISRRGETSTEITDQQIKDGITYSCDAESKTASINWSPEFYGNVKNITVEKTQYGVTQTFETYIATAKVTSRDISPYYSTFDYTVKVKAEKYDGTIIEKEFNVYNQATYKLNLHTNDGVLDADYNKYKKGEETILPIPTKEGYDFVGWFNNPEFSGDSVTAISPDVGGDLTFYAKYEVKAPVTPNQPDTPNQSDSEEESGCNKCGSLIVSLLTITSLLGLVFRKKDK